MVCVGLRVSSSPWLDAGSLGLGFVLLLGPALLLVSLTLVFYPQLIAR